MSPEGLDENESSTEPSSCDWGPVELLRRFFWCRSRWGAGDAETCGSATCSGGVFGLSADDGLDGDDPALGDCWVVIEDCLRVELDAELVVESSAISMTLQVCRVASGANDTRRCAIDFLLAARCSRMACFSALRLRSVSSPSSVDTAWSEEYCCCVGLKGSSTVSAPVMGTSALCRPGPGVEKSIRSSSPAFAGDRGLDVLRLVRNSSKDGITLGGVRGMLGFRIDLICAWSICKHSADAL